MPSRVFLGFTSHPVMEYFGIPTQCFRCQRHGHIARHCRGQQRCKVCAGPHSYKECMNKTNPKCANCGEKHCASYSGCPHKKAAAAARKHEILNGPIRNNRSPSPNLEIIRPPPVPLPPPHPPPLPPRPPRSTQQVQMSQQPPRPLYSDALKRRQQQGQISHQRTSTSGQAAGGDRQAAITPVPAPRTLRKGIHRHEHHPQYLETRRSSDVEHLLVPMFFTALRAILDAVPSANNLPEVTALFTLERLVMSSRATMNEEYSNA